jgi:hypothetical protein
MTGRSRRPLTPHEIRDAPLRRIGPRKGYEPAAVHELLRRLAEETAARERTIGELTGRLLRAGPALDPVEDPVERARLAQQYADELITVAQHAAAQIVEQARQQARQLLADADRAAQQAARAYRYAPGGSR